MDHKEVKLNFLEKLWIWWRAINDLLPLFHIFFVICVASISLFFLHRFLTTGSVFWDYFFAILLTLPVTAIVSFIGLVVIPECYDSVKEWGREYLLPRADHYKEKIQKEKLKQVDQILLGDKNGPKRS